MDQEKINFATAVVGDIEKPTLQESQEDVQLYGTTSLKCEPPIY